MQPGLFALLPQVVDAALLPALMCWKHLSLSLADVIALVGAFFVGEILLSLLLFKAHIRDRPY